MCWLFERNDIKIVIIVCTFVIYLCMCVDLHT